MAQYVFKVAQERTPYAPQPHHSDGSKRPRPQAWTPPMIPLTGPPTQLPSQPKSHLPCPTMPQDPYQVIPLSPCQFMPRHPYQPTSRLPSQQIPAIPSHPTQHTSPHPAQQSFPTTMQQLSTEIAQRLHWQSLQRVPSRSTQRLPPELAQYLSSQTMQRSPCQSEYQWPPQSTQGIPSEAPPPMKPQRPPHLPSQPPSHLTCHSSQSLPSHSMQRDPSQSTQRSTASPYTDIPHPHTQHLPSQTTPHSPFAQSFHISFPTAKPSAMYPTLHHSNPHHLSHALSLDYPYFQSSLLNQSSGGMAAPAHVGKTVDMAELEKLLRAEQTLKGSHTETLNPVELASMAKPAETDSTKFTPSVTPASPTLPSDTRSRVRVPIHKATSKAPRKSYSEKATGRKCVRRTKNRADGSANFSPQAIEGTGVDEVQGYFPTVPTTDSEQRELYLQENMTLCQQSQLQQYMAADADVPRPSIETAIQENKTGPNSANTKPSSPCSSKSKKVLICLSRLKNEYPVPSCAVGLRTALGTDNWKELLVLTEQLLDSKITMHQYRGLSRAVFAAFDEVTRRRVERILIKKVVGPIFEKNKKEETDTHDSANSTDGPGVSITGGDQVADREAM